VLKAREEIDSEPVFKANLDKIANWKFSSDGIVPEILLYHHHGSSPTTSPYNLLKGKGLFFYFTEPIQIVYNQ
jgi:hypothetical protein